MFLAKIDKERKIQPWGKIFLGVLLLGFSFCETAMADLGTHGLATVYGIGGGDCAVCHDISSTAKARGWAMAITTLTTEWLARPIAKLCYTCHSNVQAYGASDQVTGGPGNSALAYSTANHGYGLGTIATPESWSGAGTPENYTATNLPYTGAGGNIDCTTCHNVHNNERSPFVMLGSIGTDFTALCVKCHNRANDAPVLGSANSIGATVRSYHPTSVEYTDNAANGETALLNTMDAKMRMAVGAYPPSPAAPWVLGGHLTNATTGTPSATALISCQTCHQVHGSASAENQTTDLLAVDSVGIHATGANTTLCTGCHGNPYGPAADNDDQVGGAGLTDHPIDGDSGRIFYPTSWNDGGSGTGIPTWWQGANRPASDYGATEFTTAASQPTACSSCHDAHGGVAGTSILYGPDSQTEGDWCFNCHSVAGVIPDYHHSCTANDDNGATFTSQLGCGDCHGTKGGTVTNDGIWAAHNGFWDFRKGTVVSSSDSLLCAGTDNTSGCHKDIAPTTFWDGAKDGLSTYDLDSFPNSHGADQGDASHYLGPDSNEFGGVDPNVDPWPALAAEVPPIEYYSEYGGFGHTGGGNTPPSGAGDIICESCHNILYNTGSLTTPASTLYGGWQANLLLEPYEDDTAGTAQGETHDYFSGQTGDALCTECHTGSGTHHPIGPVNQTKADAAGAPNDLSFPTAATMDCDSCHRPHDADDASVTAGGSHGHTDLTRDTYHILELDQSDHNWSADIDPEYRGLCDDCHAN